MALCFAIPEGRAFPADFAAAVAAALSLFALDHEGPAPPELSASGECARGQEGPVVGACRDCLRSGAYAVKQSDVAVGPPSLVPRVAWQTRQPTAGPLVQDGLGGPPRQHGETALRSSWHTDAVDSPRMTPTSCRSLLRMANCKALWPLTAESQTRALAASRRSTRRGNCFTGRAQKTEARLASRLSLAWAANK